VRKLAIVGYGKMGRMIEQLAPEYGFDVVARLSSQRNEPLSGADVAVEFTTPAAVLGNVERTAAAGVPMVIGTTGWFNEVDRARVIAVKHRVGVVWSANFSVGVNVFTRLVETAARLLSDEPGYGAWAWEIHHSAKKDAPSGTLLKLVDAMRAAGYTREISQASNRAGAVPGTHEIGFDSAADTITLRHAARSREGFARGALKAAQWIIGRQGFYEFSEILFSSQQASFQQVKGAGDSGG
jgi:4-hydroxy-tetrahydrodipicolinate reductase